MVSERIDLHNYDLIVINSSGGKDSLCVLFKMNLEIEMQEYPKSKVHVSHQDLGKMEWPGTLDLAKRQAELFGFQFHIARSRDKYGNDRSLLDHVRLRGKWPDSTRRYCTSDHKRGPGQRVITKLSRQFKRSKILQVFGFRAEESPARKAKDSFNWNERASTKTRIVHDYLPIHSWTNDQVWTTIKRYELPYHPAYDLGMPRLSCCFCIFAPFDALVVAGKNNPELLQEYVDVEAEINHSFKQNMTIASVQEAIESGYESKSISNWKM